MQLRSSRPAEDPPAVPVRRQTAARSIPSARSSRPASPPAKPPSSLTADDELKAALAAPMQLRSGRSALAADRAPSPHPSAVELGPASRAGGQKRGGKRVVADSDEKKEPAVKGSRAEAAASSAASAATEAHISPRLRLPLTLMPSTEIPDRRIVDTDVGALTMLRVSTSPLVMRVPGFMPQQEVDSLLEAVQAATSAAASSPGAVDGAPNSPVQDPKADWTRYEALVYALNRNAISPTATMYRCELRGVPSTHPMLLKLVQRLARICQAPVANVSALTQVLKYEPGQEFMLHKDDRTSPTPPRGRRLITALLYLKLEYPEEPGGGTFFPSLLSGPYRSSPDAGTLLLFRNFPPEDPDVLDWRTEHRAEPTKLGYKMCLQCYVCTNAGVDGHWD